MDLHLFIFRKHCGGGVMKVKRLIKRLANWQDALVQSLDA